MWLELRGLPRFKVLPDRFGPERLFGQSVSSNHIHVHARTDTCNHTHGRIARPRLASPRLAPLATSPHSPRHACPRLAFARLLASHRSHRSHRLAWPHLAPRIASQHRIASPLARIASLSIASPRFPSPRLDRHRRESARSPRLALLASPRCSPRLSRLASPLSPCFASLALPRLVRLASPRSPCLASRSLASPRLRARLPRSPCLLPRLGHRAARHLGLSLPSTLPSKPARHTRSSIEPPNSIFGWDGYSQFELG